MPSSSLVSLQVSVLNVLICRDDGVFWLSVSWLDSVQGCVHVFRSSVFPFLKRILLPSGDVVSNPGPKELGSKSAREEQLANILEMVQRLDCGLYVFVSVEEPEETHKVWQTVMASLGCLLALTKPSFPLQNLLPLTAQSPPRRQ